MSQNKYDAGAIKASVDIVELASRYVQLKKRGSEYVGLCKFHNDTTEPGNFMVNGQKQVWACFACGEQEKHGADAIGLLQSLEGIDFNEACRRLLNGSGTQPPQKPIAQRELTKPPPRITCAPPEDVPPAPLHHKQYGDPAGTWTYRTETGALLGYVCRWDTPEGKEYRCITWGQQGNAPAGWERKHFHDAQGLRPIYGLDRLAQHPAKQVIITEGEKAADAAQRLFPGMVAVTWPGGANAIARVDWSPLRNRKVVLWPDNDDPGIECMAKLARTLAAICTEIKGLRVTDMPAGWDAADYDPALGDALSWAKPRVFIYENDISDSEIDPPQPDIPPEPAEIPLEAYGGDAARFGYPDTTDHTTDHATAPQPPVSAKLVGIYDHQEPDQPATSASMGLISTCLADVQAEPILWLWDQRLACGKLSIITGNPGLGKSQITASLAAVVSTGGKWPVTRDQAPQGSVIILSAEDDPKDTIRPRMEAAGADLSRVHLISAIKIATERGEPSTRGFDISRDIDRLRLRMAELGDVRLVIIDPISAYMGKADSHNNTEVRAVLAPLQEAAQQFGAAILAVSHLNKSQGQDALLKTQGSVGFVAAARAVWGVAKDKDNPSRRLFMPLKNNLGTDETGLAYSIEEYHLEGTETDDRPRIKTSRVLWENALITQSAEEVFGTMPEEERTAVDEAADFLRDLLKFGPVVVKDVEFAGKKAGHTMITIRRAKAKIGIKPSKRTGGSGEWQWSLPD